MSISPLKFVNSYPFKPTKDCSLKKVSEYPNFKTKVDLIGLAGNMFHISKVNTQ